MRIFEFIECSNSSKSLPELFDLLTRAAEKEGFETVAYGGLTYDEPLRMPDHSALAIASNYPREWRVRYFDRKYYPGGSRRAVGPKHAWAIFLEIG